MADAPSSTPGTEIERKFLVTRLPPDLASYPSARIEQGYLAVDAQGAVVRLRRTGEQRILTIKAGHGIERAEEELFLDAGPFDRLWPLTAGRRVEKVRYLVPAADGLTIELDVYEGALGGLATAEVESTSRAAVERFVPEPWMRSNSPTTAAMATARSQRSASRLVPFAESTACSTARMRAAAWCRSRSTSSMSPSPH